MTDLNHTDFSESALQQLEIHCTMSNTPATPEINSNNKPTYHLGGKWGHVTPARLSEIVENYKECKREHIEFCRDKSHPPKIYMGDYGFRKDVDIERYLTSLKTLPNLNNDEFMAEFSAILALIDDDDDDDDDDGSDDEVKYSLVRHPEEAVAEPIPEPIAAKTISEEIPAAEPEPEPEPSYRDELDEIFNQASQANYTPEHRERFRQLAVQFSELGIEPAKRGYRKFNFKQAGVKSNAAASLYMNDLQTFDLQWIWAKHHGHKTDGKVLDGMFSGIFTEVVFDWDIADKIARGNHGESGKPLTSKTKAKHLKLPEFIQCQLSTLKLEAVRKRQSREVLADRQEMERAAQIEIEAMDIRHQLTTRKKSRIRDTEVYVNIWVAIKLSGDNKSNLAGIMSAYETRTGEPINVSTLRDKIKYLTEALKDSRV